MQKLSWVWQTCAQCQVAAQAGVWDVDGTGMWAIEDPEVDLGIRKVHTSIPPFAAAEHAPQCALLMLCLHIPTAVQDGSCGSIA